MDAKNQARVAGPAAFRAAFHVGNLTVLGSSCIEEGGEANDLVNLNISIGQNALLRARMTVKFDFGWGAIHMLVGWRWLEDCGLKSGNVDGTHLLGLPI